MSINPRPRGRPPKFEGARHPVTTTLPEGTLQQLAALDDDRAVAIVKAAAAATRPSNGKKPLVELMDVCAGDAVIIVAPSKCLRSIEWLHLVEITPSRFLMAVPTGTPVEALELAVADLLDNLPSREDHERTILTELRGILSHRRRTQPIRKMEIMFLRVK